MPGRGRGWAFARGGKGLRVLWQAASPVLRVGGGVCLPPLFLPLSGAGTARGVVRDALKW